MGEKKGGVSGREGKGSSRKGGREKGRKEGGRPRVRSFKRGFVTGCWGQGGGNWRARQEAGAKVDRIIGHVVQCVSCVGHKYCVDAVTESLFVHWLTELSQATSCRLESCYSCQLLRWGDKNQPSVAGGAGGDCDALRRLATTCDNDC